MRLAQIARKVGLTPIDVKRFLESEFDITIGNEPNYKLDEGQISAVMGKFPIPEPVVVAPPVKATPADEEEIEAPVETITNDEEQFQEATAEKEVEATPAMEIEEETTPEESIAEATPAKEEEEEEEEQPSEESTEESQEVEISYDEPENEEDTEAPFIEAAVDREAELIKAPKVKLDGLKVLGKIELPQEKVEEVVQKTEEDIAQEEADALAELDAAMQSQAQDIKPAKVAKRKESKETKAHLTEEEAHSEYKDQRGIYHFSLQQKLNREKALVRIELDKKRQAEKEKKKRHYEDVMKERKQNESATQSKAKQKKIASKKEKREQKNIEPPKGLWAKFLRWLND